MKKILHNLSLLFAVVVISVFASNVVADEDYSAGMKAYISGDFNTAKTYWLKASQSNNARAMFNLGLLHERGQISDASQQNADRWFRQAGQAGYPAADYHMAQRLKARGEQAAANEMLNKAANAGFVLAQEELGGEFTNTQNLGTQQIQTRPVTKATQPPSEPRQPTVQKSPQKAPQETSQAVVKSAVPLPAQSTAQTQPSPPSYLGETWIKSQDSDSWTIQMLAFSDETKVRNFIDAHGLHRSAAYFSEGKSGAEVYKLIYGVYATKEEASNARDGFTSALKEHGPWLRPIKGVQAIINGG